MVDQELLSAIGQMMDEKLNPIVQRLDRLEGKVDALEGKVDVLDEKIDTLEQKVDTLAEAHEETRAGVNSLLEWAEECGNVIKFPLPKVK